MQGLSMMITKAEGAMLHQLPLRGSPEDSRAYPSEERIKAFHVKLDVFLAANYGGEADGSTARALGRGTRRRHVWMRTDVAVLAPARWPRRGSICWATSAP